MDYQFEIKFKNFDALFVKFNDGRLSQDYTMLFYRNYQKQLPILRDMGAYNIEYMRELAIKCKDILGWDWINDRYDDYEVTTRMHKDIEKYAGKGFDLVNSEHDQLLHELHICLHSTQQHNQRETIQLEWFNDDGFSLQPYDFNFVHDYTLGAVILQNPYVGHPPDWIWKQNDYSNIWQTCKFHDFVRPGMVIQMKGNIEKTVKPFTDVDNYISWWKQHAPDFLKHHGIEKMIANTGNPVIGYIINNQDLIPLQTATSIELEYVKINPKLNLDSLSKRLPELPGIRKHDYENVAGPDWPSYDDFLADKNVPDFVKQEIATMLY